MKVFNVTYNAYFGLVAHILRFTTMRRVTVEEIRQFAITRGLTENREEIVAALQSEYNKLVREDGSSPIRKQPVMALTTFQKRWLKSVTADPRFKLFDEEIPDLDGVKPLFTPDNYKVLDRFSDGDPYDKERYINNFRTVRQALHDHTTLDLSVRTRSGHRRSVLMLPSAIEYSEKDDKFRVVGSGQIVNMKNIITAERSQKKISHSSDEQEKYMEVIFELDTSLRSIDETLHHFSHFAKEVTKDKGDIYRIKLICLADDETEVLIRILSFGPAIKVLSPTSIRDGIKSRIRKQMTLL